MIEKIKAWFLGKKTYITAICTFVVAGLLAIGVIDVKTAEIVGLVLGSLGITLNRLAATPNG